MKNTLITLAEIHYDLGLIAHDELCERIDVALWLSDRYDIEDPRHAPSDPKKNQNAQTISGESKLLRRKSPILSEDGKEQYEMFICLTSWIFTKTDAVSYPSVPFGFYRNPNNPWPKLNPYTGRVFVAKHQEDVNLRLSKVDIQNIWQDERFKSFCREIIIWYQEQYRSEKFPLRNQLRSPTTNEQ